MSVAGSQRSERRGSLRYVQRRRTPQATGTCHLEGDGRGDWSFKFVDFCSQQKRHVQPTWGPFLFRIQVNSDLVFNLPTVQTLQERIRFEIELIVSTENHFCHFAGTLFCCDLVLSQRSMHLFLSGEEYQDTSTCSTTTTRRASDR